MDKQSLFKSIAKFAILKGNDVVDDNFFLEEALDGNSCDELDTFVKTVSHFVSLYDKEFKDALLYHCNAETSEEQFLNFVKLGIKVLGGLEGNFSYLLPCAFVREAVHQLKKKFEKKFLNQTLICLEQFLRRKFEGSEPNNIWKQLLGYCEDMNEKLSLLESSSESEGSNDDQSQDVKSGLSPAQIYVEKRRILIADTELDNKIAELIYRM